MSKLKKIPYGISDFERIQKENYYYVDKTQFIEKIEQSPDYLFLIRPRRFGKSLFTSIIESYYDVDKKGIFEEVYGDTYIGRHPTGNQNKYLVLTFNFAEVNPAMDKVETSFEEHCDACYYLFNKKYGSYFDENYFTVFQQKQNSYSKLEHILKASKFFGLNLYIIIDEYDNFANTILSKPITGQDDYQKLTKGDSAFRHFFNKLKGGTTGSGAPLSRLFITGVSPLTMDDVTSGFNIGNNITTDPNFSEVLGFTQDEVNEMFQYYFGKNAIDPSKGNHPEVMKKWYNSYKFAISNSNPLYNSDMVLYYIEKLIRIGTPPYELIDPNVKTDYGKLRYLVTLDRKLNGNFSKLKQVIDNGEVNCQLYTSFPVKELSNPDKFVSLLFYFGLITISGTKRNMPVFKIPNETIKSFFSEYIQKAYSETGVFKFDTFDFGNLVSDMAYEGNWKPVFELLDSRIKQQTSIRDYISGEQLLKGFLLVYLNLTDHFYIHSEKEMNKGYADLYLEPFLAYHSEMKYSYLIEIKYIKRQEKTIPDSKIQELCKQAEELLHKYSSDDFVKQTKGDTELVKIVLVYHGWELIKYYAAH